MIDYKIVGFHIKENRKKQGYSQEKFAELLEISTTYLSLIENGHRPANLELLISISQHLGISVDFLLFGNQKGDDSSAARAFQDLLSECNMYERAVIIKATERLKDVLKLYEHLK